MIATLDTDICATVAAETVLMLALPLVVVNLVVVV
jgi:hypothetical protein